MATRQEPASIAMQQATITADARLLRPAVPGVQRAPPFRTTLPGTRVAGHYSGFESVGRGGRTPLSVMALLADTVVHKRIPGLP